MRGLTTIQSIRLLNQYGLNVISEQKKKNIFIKFFEQFNNFLTILLVLAALFSFFIGEAVDGILIISIVVLNALFGLYQEAKAEESIAALKKMTVTKVRVIRDGKQKEIDSKYLVPGDTIFIEEGTKIAADGEVVDSVNLETNESALTGESLSVAKKINNELFSGTIVTKGRGFMKVIATGMKTKFGSIAMNLSTIEDTETPLQKKLADLTRMIGIVGIFLAFIVFIISFLEGSGYFPAFLLAISLAVAVVPEGLPAVMTITLAIGVKKMAGKRAIIRKLSAIEALGSITLIATDKTGTLTTNKMKVKEVFVDNKLYESSNLPSSQNNPFRLMILDGILCSTASLSYNNERESFEVLGDPTEGALLYLAQDVNFAPEIIKKEWKLLAEKPFDSISKTMSVVVQRGPSSSKEAGSHLMFSKGAPESILVTCDKILIGKKEIEMGDQQKGTIEKQVEAWAKKGLRVLAFAYSKSQVQSVKSNNLTFLGLVAIHDAPRPEIVEAVQKAKAAGIKVIMITGDNEKTAEAIGVTAGIITSSKDTIMNGEELERYTDDELIQRIQTIRIFARTNPFQKHRIVKLYQQLGEIVAVTGDGVNDAIALKQADVGVAMGLVGTDVARETADMVITDDNFATIVNAIEEGRNIIKNLKNAVKYLLSCNMSEAIALIVGLLLGLPTFLYPIQLLYINLVTDGLPALTLAFSPRNQHAMESSPEKELKLLNMQEKQYIFFVGSIGAVLVLTSFYIFSGTISHYDRLANTAAFSVLTLIQSFIFVDLWLSHRSLHRHIPLLLSPLFFIAFLIPFLFQFAIVSHPFAASIFKIQQASIYQYLGFIVLASLIFVGIKGVKKVIQMK
ncbi:cation-translocating P-type ATPase [Candidatus Roizmanbacteria bacterium]|nr:cation-translocating P-type ATPase [Candidatus Roizmanbacteria bacterium]